MQPRILAVGHDAFRAGSQIAFLHLLQWLKPNYDAEFSLILREGGPLLAEFSQIAPAITIEKSLNVNNSPSLARLQQQITRRHNERRTLVKPGTTNLIYANSAASAPLAVRLSHQSGAPVLCHVHELEMSLRRFAAGFDAVTEHIDHYIAVCDAVKSNLVDNHGIPAERIDVINPAVSRSGHVETVKRPHEIRAELGIAPDAFVIGGCGTADWRKGPDLFLLSAAALSRRNPQRPICFVWLGGDPEQLALAQHDIDRLGLSDIVRFIAPRPHPASYFALFDAFLLTSREDPFPLVCLEAAALGVPTVCFAGAGGMPEFVEADAGFVVDYLDIDAVVVALEALIDSPELRGALGRRAAEKVQERNDIAVVGNQITAVFDRMLVSA